MTEAELSELEALAARATAGGRAVSADGGDGWVIGDFGMSSAGRRQFVVTAGGQKSEEVADASDDAAFCAGVTPGRVLELCAEVRRLRAALAEAAAADARFIAAAVEALRRVNARAEADMLRGGPITGAHHRSIKAELAALAAHRPPGSEETR